MRFYCVNNSKGLNFYEWWCLNYCPSKFTLLSDKHFCNSLFIYSLKCISGVMFQITNFSWFVTINFVPKRKKIHWG